MTASRHERTAEHVAQYVHRRRRGTSPKVLAERERLATRDVQAFQLRVAGVTYAEIARVLGYSAKSSVQAAVKRQIGNIEAVSVTQREEARQLDLARTDKILSAWWTRAIGAAPDEAATRVVFKALAHRAELLHLAQPVTLNQNITVESLDTEIHDTLAAYLAGEVDGTASRVPATPVT